MIHAGCERGTTLLQVTILIAVVAIAAGAALPLAIRAIEIGEERLAERQLDELGEGLLAFYRDHARFPDAAEGLASPPSCPR